MLGAEKYHWFNAQQRRRLCLNGSNKTDREQEDETNSRKYVKYNRSTDQVWCPTFDKQTLILNTECVNYF